MIGLPTQFDLVITTNTATDVADFHLQDDHGTQLAFHQADFKNISASHRRGVFDLRNYLDIYIDPGNEAAAIADVGVAIAQNVLGQAIIEKLWDGTHQRTLLIHLPGSVGGQDNLAAALAQVPWEIAKPNAGASTLGERNLLIRVSHKIKNSPSYPVKLESNEALRVLFIFAEARGSRPLSARKERRELLRLFKSEIYPKRRIVAHFLTHGVTRERLLDQIQQHSGYHIVHWSGHGTLNLLELARPGGAEDSISGDELLALFNDAGGFLPRLVFLSACQSGDSLQARDWHDFFSITQGNEPKTREADVEQLEVKTQLNVTGTAYALLNGGVPSVVAMRYAVSDDYARELAVKFYRALLADIKPKDVAAALNLARKELANNNISETSRFTICDHATAVLYGSEQPGLSLIAGRSPEAHHRAPRLHQIAELSATSHEHFVGRTWELTSLGSDFIGSRDGHEIKPMAVITGLGGMGKTALVAEALELWAVRFDWILLYQAKSTALTFEATLRDIHLKLTGELGSYYHRTMQFPAEAIYRDASNEFTGPKRVERLIHNLVEALQQEAILLVLDNFETNLKPQAESVEGKPFWTCQDPAWDACLKALAVGLAGSTSRVLITSRQPLMALTDNIGLHILLGPLPSNEAALYLRAHPVLCRMAVGSDDRERSLALRLLNASRFHPLLMDRLARLATAPELHGQLIQALETLENTKKFADLPDIFATTTSNANERAYLNDALTLSLDQFIRHINVDKRLLLWMIAVANEPVALGLLKRVWLGESHQLEFMREVKRMIENNQEPPTELKKLVTPEFRALIANLPPKSTKPEIEPLLRDLVNVGLITEKKTGSDDHNPDLACHELVRERIQAWMEQQPDDKGELSENTIRLAYAAQLEAFFEVMQHKDLATALQAGSQALVYCVQAQAWDQMDGFASGLVTSNRDQRLVEGLIPHLKMAAESAPTEHMRLSFLCNLADALSTAGQLEASSQFYCQAAVLARMEAEAGNDAQQAWSSLATINCNWAAVHSELGDLNAARQCYLESTEAEKKAGCVALNILINELEILNIDIRQGEIEKAEPEVTKRLALVCQWWNHYLENHPVPEAPNPEVLARTVIRALNIGENIDELQGNWTSALCRLDAVLDIEHSLARSPEDIGITRFNRASILMELPARLNEARDELEACFQLFQNTPHLNVKILSNLARLAEKQGDLNHAIIQEQRALVLHENLSDPSSRSCSHNNLANYLVMRGTKADLEEQRHHRLAGLIYCIVTDSRQELSTTLENYFFELERANAESKAFHLPLVIELLSDPVFAALAQWLSHREVDVADLQVIVDHLFEQLRQITLNRSHSDEDTHYI